MSKFISKIQLLDMPEGTIFATAHHESRGCVFYTSGLYRKGKTVQLVYRSQCEAIPLFVDGDDRTPRPARLVEVRHMPDTRGFECNIIVYEDEDILALYRGLETELSRITGKPTSIGPQRAAPSSPARVEAQSRSALREYNETVSAIDPDGFKKEIYSQPGESPDSLQPLFPSRYSMLCLSPQIIDHGSSPDVPYYVYPIYVTPEHADPLSPAPAQPAMSPRERRFLSRLEEGGE